MAGVLPTIGEVVGGLNWVKKNPLKTTAVAATAVASLWTYFHDGVKRAVSFNGDIESELEEESAKSSLSKQSDSEFDEEENEDSEEEDIFEYKRCDNRRGDSRTETELDTDLALNTPSSFGWYDSVDGYTPQGNWWAQHSTPSTEFLSCTTTPDCMCMRCKSKQGEDSFLVSDFEQLGFRSESSLPGLDNTQAGSKAI